MESYTTPLDDEDTSVDEYQVFKEVHILRYVCFRYLFIELCPKQTEFICEIFSEYLQVMQQLEASQVEWYTRLVAPLSENDKKSLQEVFTLANQRRKARESKNIEQAGGNFK